MSGECILETRGLCKRFGGVNATDDISLCIHRGEVHALIGPNGAGKTTLISQLSGLLRADSGRIIFDGENVTRKSAPALAKRGLARSFQITSVFQELTVMENVAIAVQVTQGSSFRFFGNAAVDPSILEPAEKVLSRTGLADKRAVLASRISHGERRQLEIAMALATEPKMLLLDEPMAGMGPAESNEMIALLASLKGDKTMLLVEHDMDTVFSLADRISVLVYGRVIATGSPDEIRENQQVRQAYLGDE